MHFFLLLELINEIIDGVSSAMSGPEKSVPALDESLSQNFRLSFLEHFPNATKIV